MKVPNLKAGPRMQTLNNILEQRELQRDAGIMENAARRILTDDWLILDLSVARPQNNPLQDLFEFRSFAIKNVDTSNSDGQSHFYMALNQKTIGSQFVRYTTNESKNNFDSMWTGINLWWPAQAGRKLGINFSRDAWMQSGNSNVTGTVQLAKPASGPTAVVAIPATTATLVLAANSLRDSAQIRNQTGNIIYVSDNNLVSPANGMPVFHNEREPIPWTGTVYVYGLAAGNVAVQEYV